MRRALLAALAVALGTFGVTMGVRAYSSPPQIGAASATQAPPVDDTQAPAAPAAPSAEPSPTPTPAASGTLAARSGLITAAPTTKAAAAVVLPTGWPAANVTAEAEVLRLVNDERAKVGCAPVAVEAHLTAAARQHSLDMAQRNYFSHDTPEGVKAATRMTNAGYQWSMAGENIAAGQRTPADVMKSWMNSAGHRANILNCAYKHLGVGFANGVSGSAYPTYWTQDFGAPR
jgi:uncharacterized protein YkwD